MSGTNGTTAIDLAALMSCLVMSAMLGLGWVFGNKGVVGVWIPENKVAFFVPDTATVPGCSTCSALIQGQL